LNAAPEVRVVHALALRVSQVVQLAFARPLHRCLDHSLVHRLPHLFQHFDSGLLEPGELVENQRLLFLVDRGVDQ
jgi:hypothetical protein